MSKAITVSSVNSETASELIYQKRSGSWSAGKRAFDFEVNRIIGTQSFNLVILVDKEDPEATQQAIWNDLFFLGLYSGLSQPKENAHV